MTNFVIFSRFIGMSSSVGRAVGNSLRRLISGMNLRAGCSIRTGGRVIHVYMSVCVLCLSAQRRDIACVSMIPSVGVY